MGPVGTHVRGCPTGGLAAAPSSSGSGLAVQTLPHQLLLATRLPGRHFQPGAMENGRYWPAPLAKDVKSRQNRQNYRAF